MMCPHPRTKFCCFSSWSRSASNLIWWKLCNILRRAREITKWTLNLLEWLRSLYRGAVIVTIGKSDESFSMEKRWCSEKCRMQFRKMTRICLYFHGVQFFLIASVETYRILVERELLNVLKQLGTLGEMIRHVRWHILAAVHAPRVSFGRLRNVYILCMSTGHARGFIFDDTGIWTCASAMENPN
jgi:hypothetical protein